MQVYKCTELDKSIKINKQQKKKKSILHYLSYLFSLLCFQFSLESLLSVVIYACASFSFPFEFTSSSCGVKPTEIGKVKILSELTTTHCVPLSATNASKA